MGFNLFAELAADLALADRAVHTWWSDVPGTVGTSAPSIAERVTDSEPGTFHAAPRLRSKGW